MLKNGPSPEENEFLLPSFLVTECNRASGYVPGHSSIIFSESLCIILNNLMQDILDKKLSIDQMVAI
jgi:hypothetical protein